MMPTPAAMGVIAYCVCVCVCVCAIVFRGEGEGRDVCVSNPFFNGERGLFVSV
jgi:hypothetical protein